jgi:type IV pilus assembly protein PilA
MISSAIKRLNDRRDGAGDLGEDAGFTLIELMVVLLILAILLAIAIPTFLGVTGGANDRAAQSNLNTALTNAKASAEQGGQSYANVTVGVLASNEPALSWTTGALTAQGPVSVYVDTTASTDNGGGIVMASYSKNKGECWFIVDNLGYVTGAAGNGAYTATTASPGSAGTATSAPTQAGTWYGKAPIGSCNPGAATVGATWSNVSFAALG